jgi:hypothetical protein
MTFIGLQLEIITELLEKVCTGKLTLHYNVFMHALTIQFPLFERQLELPGYVAIQVKFRQAVKG